MQHDQFRQDLLRQMGEAMGLTYEQLTADYDAALPSHEQEVREEAARWWRRWFAIEAEHNARMQRVINDVVFQIYIEDNLAAMVERVVGYHPQRLLPAPDGPIVFTIGFDEELHWRLGHIPVSPGWRENAIASTPEVRVWSPRIEHFGEPVWISTIANALEDMPVLDAIEKSRPGPLRDRPDYLHHDPTKAHRPAHRKEKRNRL